MSKSSAHKKQKAFDLLCKQAFSCFDKKGVGITIEELSTVIKVMQTMDIDIFPNAETLQGYIDAVKKDKNGRIHFNAFRKMMQKISNDHKEDPEEIEMLAAFKEFDKNNDGMISRKEIRMAMAELGQQMEEKEIDDMIKKSDSNKDGVIDYKEFVKMIQSL